MTPCTNQIPNKRKTGKKIEEFIKEGCATLDLAIKETLKKEVDAGTAKEIIVRSPRIVKIMPQKEQFPKAMEIGQNTR